MQGPDDETVILRFSRDRAFPISTLTSVALHIGFIALVVLGVFSLFRRERPAVVEFEPVMIAEAPGGGASGVDDATGLGTPEPVQDAVGVVEKRRPVPALPVSSPMPIIPRPEPQPEIEDVGDPLNRRLADLKPLPSLKPLLKGLPDAPPARSGVGAGTGQGSGTGPGTGEGDGAAGRLSQKQKRQLRWTLLFNIDDAADYLDQLHRLKAIIGVQYHDKSIRLIHNLRQRPARLEPVEGVPDRIFWMDDNVEAVKSMAEELGIHPVPWRIIAFFPAELESELLRKEKAYGQRFGREEEDDFAETVFRVEDRFGVISISVARQTGKVKAP